MIARSELINLTDVLREVRTDVTGIRLMAMGLDQATGNHDAECVMAAAERLHDKVDGIIDRMHEFIPVDPTAT